MKTKRPSLLRNIAGLSVGVLLTGCAAHSLLSSSDHSSDTSQVIASQYLTQARKAFQRENYGIAIHYLNRELAERPHSITALNGLGASYDQLRRHDVAQRYYFKALEMDPESGMTLANIGVSYLMQGRYRESQRVLELATARDPDNMVAANNLAKARQAMDSEPQEPLIAAADTTQLPETPKPQPSSAKEPSKPQSPPAKAAPTPPPVEPTPETPEPQDLQEDDEALIVEAPKPSAAPATEASEPRNAQEDNAVRIADAPDASVAPTSQTPEPLLVRDDDKVQIIEAPKPSAAPATEASEPPNVQEDHGDQIAEAPKPSVAPTSQIPEPLLVQEDNQGQIVEASKPSAAPAPQKVRENDSPAETAQVSEAPEQPLGTGTGQPVRLEISNGNGTHRLATATSRWIAEDDVVVNRITNAGSFDYKATLIVHRPELAEAAREISSMLQVDAVVHSSERLPDDVDIRVVLGHDMPGRVVAGRLAMPGEFALLPAGLRVEVSNGNGVGGMAHRIRGYLRERGGNVVRLTNAANFDYPNSVLYYRQGHRREAERLCESLPLGDVTLEESTQLVDRVDAKLLLGHDFIAFDPRPDHGGTLASVQ